MYKEIFILCTIRVLNQTFEKKKQLCSSSIHKGYIIYEEFIRTRKLNFYASKIYMQNVTWNFHQVSGFFFCVWEKIYIMLAHVWTIKTPPEYTFPIRTTVGISRPTTQWAAVKINSSEIIDPPQLKAKSSPFISCDGYPNAACKCFFLKLFN